MYDEAAQDALLLFAVLSGKSGISKEASLMQGNIMQPETKPSRFPLPISIKVIGLGGCGSNLASNLRLPTDQIDLIVANTDQQDLAGRNNVAQRILLGPQQTAGKGAGGFPDIGAAAARESEPILSQALAGADLVVIIAGMGGGTGTGAAPEVARLARRLGALTLAFVTMPFQVEKGQRTRTAEQGLATLNEAADAVVVVSNQKILSYVPPDTTLTAALMISNTILSAAIEGVVNQLSLPALMQLDFSHVRQTLSSAGLTMLGIGSATGVNAAQRAIEQALRCDLLEGNLTKARRVFVSIIGGSNLNLFDVNEAIQRLHSTFDDEIELAVGVVATPYQSARDRVRVTLIASGTPSFRSLQPRDPARAVPVLFQPDRTSTTTSVDTLDLPPFLKFRQRGKL